MNNTRKAREVIAEARDLLGGNGILLDFHVMRHMADIEVDPHLRGHRDDPDADRRPRHHRRRRVPLNGYVNARAEMRVLMLAPPGGKGTQGVRIAEELGVEHISSGDLLRAAVAEDTPLGREVAEHMAAGRLAPDEVVVQAVKPVLDTRDGYVLDGFPRTLAQTGGLEFDAVIHLDVPDEVTRERLLARGRGGDSVAVIEKRLREYAQDTGAAGGPLPRSRRAGAGRHPAAGRGRAELLERLKRA